jgi:hypothetical protein
LRLREDDERDLDDPDDERDLEDPDLDDPDDERDFDDPDDERDLDDPDDERDPEAPEDDERCREGVFFSSSSPSSSSPKSFSFTPSSAPFVFDSAPPSPMDSISSGSPCASSLCAMSRRPTASAKRRYVSTLAITIRASIVRISMPISETRT